MFSDSHGPARVPPSLNDEVSKAATAKWHRQRTSHDRLLLPLKVILDRVATETQLTEEESIEFGSDITTTLRLVYKHTFRMLREYHSLERRSAERRSFIVLREVLK